MSIYPTLSKRQESDTNSGSPEYRAGMEELTLCIMPTVFRSTAAIQSALGSRPRRLTVIVPVDRWKRGPLVGYDNEIRYVDLHHYQFGHIDCLHQALCGAIFVHRASDY